MVSMPKQVRGKERKNSLAVEMCICRCYQSCNVSLVTELKNVQGTIIFVGMKFELAS